MFSSFLHPRVVVFGRPEGQPVYREPGTATIRVTNAYSIT
ncbi:hypothetical protein MGWOODY_XGa2497 [hydrothermal vent metagenome]|uniref:Uncharacterized protein n=1 Tax=hydrothermal vent metagenome TaxID=652676 RepID=A0A170PRB7_9ZZZZ